MGIRELVKFGVLREDVLVDRRGRVHRIGEKDGVFYFDPPIEDVGPDGVRFRIVGYDARKNMTIVRYPEGEERKITPWP